jgi:hypothetical protein
MKQLLSGMTATVLIAVAAAAWAQVPMSPSTAPLSGAAAGPPAPMAEAAPSKRPKRATKRARLRGTSSDNIANQLNAQELNNRSSPAPYGAPAYGPSPSPGPSYAPPPPRAGPPMYRPVYAPPPPFWGYRPPPPWVYAPPPWWYRPY